MPSVVALIDSGRLVAPREHLGVLVEPAQAGWNAARTGAAFQALEGVAVLDRPLGEWRGELRRQLALVGPVFAAGHQVEFFHAGVLAKTVAVQALATLTGGSAVCLVVDCDLPKTTRLTVPQITARELRAVDVVIPGLEAQRAMETQPAASRADWLDFFVQVASLYEHYEACLLRTFADAWLADPAAHLEIGDAMSRAWGAVAGALGLPGVRPLRASALCQTPAFRAFAAHLLLHAPRLADEYNRAQSAYRRRHRLRNPAQPVPPLATAPGVTETPLWAFRDDGRRRRLYVAENGAELELRAGGESLGRLERAWLADPVQAGRPWPPEEHGWRLRPRALTLSAFARLFLADLFIHGIGGAKYDEITDDFLRGFLGREPPPIACVSATLHLPLPRRGVRPAEVLAARRQCRDLLFNPQRYARDVPPHLLGERAELIRRSQELAARRSRDRNARRQLFEDLRRVNDAILAGEPGLVVEFEQRALTAERQAALDAIALNREYFAALHLKATLQQLVERVRGALT